MKKIELFIIIGLIVVFGSMYLVVSDAKPIESISNFITGTEEVEEPGFEGYFVVVHDEEVVMEIDPNINTSYTFMGSDGPMIAEVENGMIRLIHTECPEQLCVHQGWMSLDDRVPIICLPNEVMISSSTAMFN